MLDPLKANVLPEEDENADGDVFVKSTESAGQNAPDHPQPDVFEELPIEIRSLTERYVNTSKQYALHTDPLSL
jgi:hypothetical protein